MTEQTMIFVMGFCAGLFFQLMYDFIEDITNSHEDDEDNWF